MSPVSPTRIVLASADLVFAALCKRALEAGATPKIVETATPPQLLQKTRDVSPDFVVLDADGEDVTALKALATKVMLVSGAPIVLVSGYLAAGSPGLSSLLQSIAAAFVQKPEGPSSLGLVGEEGPRFAAALDAAFAAQDEADFDDLDGGWDEDERAADAGAADD